MVRRVGFGALAAGGAVLALKAIFDRPAGAAETSEMDKYTQAAQGDPEAMKELNQKYGASAVKKSQARVEGQNNTNAFMGILGGAANGAMTGAAFGPWGALIGGVLGAGASLMDKGTREGAMKFVKGFMDSVGKTLGDIGNFFSNRFSEIGKGVQDMGKSVQDGLVRAGKWIVDTISNGVKGLANLLLDAITLLPRFQVGMVKNLIQNASWVPGRDGILSSINNIESLLNTRVHYGGLNYGSALAREGMMSGRRAMVVNDSEFVIPQGGFSQLVDAVGNRVVSSGKLGGGEAYTKIDLAINVINPVMLGDNKELIESLRKPVITIVNDAYNKVNGVRSRNRFITA